MPATSQITTTIQKNITNPISIPQTTITIIYNNSTNLPVTTSIQTTKEITSQTKTSATASTIIPQNITNYTTTTPAITNSSYFTTSSILLLNLYFLINNNLVSSNISFGSLDLITLTCQAVNSLPSINLQVVDMNSGIKLPLVKSTQLKPNPFQICDSFNVCQSLISVQLTPGFAYFNNIKNIVCSAFNTALNTTVTSISLDLNFNGDSCLNNGCKNGTCRVNSSNDLGYICECLPDFGGQFCNYSCKFNFQCFFIENKIIFFCKIICVHPVIVIQMVFVHLV
jgi:hypothetical protein